MQAGEDNAVTVIFGILFIIDRKFSPQLVPDYSKFSV